MPFTSGKWYIYTPVPVATILLASPISNASLADTGRPVRIRSRARDSPMRAGRRMVPPSIRGTPYKQEMK